MPLLRGLIAGFVRNPVLANLLMVCLLAGGYYSARSMVRETYPEFGLNHIVVEAAYPGAAPEDVERAICTPIEEAIRGVRGIRMVSSSSNADFGSVWIALLEEVGNAEQVLSEIKDRVERITDWPAEAEKPIVHETFLRGEVINIAIHGDVEDRTLKGFARGVRDDLVARSGVSQISLSGVRDDEILIEVPEDALQAYGLSLDEIISAVARGSLDLPAGVIRTAGEELTLRVAGQRYHAVDYEDLVVLERGDAVVRLGEFATVKEGFEDAVVVGRFEGQPAVVVQVFKTPDEDATDIARTVREYAAERQAGLPDGLHMSVWADHSLNIESRIAMLFSNGALGIVLVFVMLLIFMELPVAFWVAVGIPISFAGALIVMRVTGQTINMISVFGLIIVSGIIVDDAIVIADSVYARRRRGDQPALASIDGTVEVALPVLGASVTTIIAFIPLMYVTGIMGRFIYVLPVVVIAAICASSVEAFGVLPSHLCHREPPGMTLRQRTPNRIRREIETLIDRVITHWYRPVFRTALRNRFATISFAAAGLLWALGLVLGGREPLVFFPQEDANILRARVRFPEGAPGTSAINAAKALEAAAWELNSDSTLRPAKSGPLVRQVYSITGEFADFVPIRGNNLCETQIELMPAEERLIRDEVVMARWREHVGAMHDATEFQISRQQIGPTDRPIEVRLLGDNLQDMAAAAESVKAKLREFEGVTNVQDDLIPGRRELQVTLRPSGRALGLTLEDVARQLRQGFHGGEALRLYRDREQVKVRVRFPEEERKSILDLEGVRLATPSGHDIPFLEVADIARGQGYASILHQNGKRRVRVVADVDERIANADAIIRTLQGSFLDGVVRDYNDLTWQFGGDRERMDESLVSLRRGFDLALIAIYTILAGMLRSYVQPIVILIAVPFGLVGVVFGHYLLGMDLSLLSLFGIVALSGIVVNDSLVLVDVINIGIREGKSLRESVEEAGERRFRAVILTSVTTIAGLAPLLASRSSQAQSIIPMAVSLVFGLAASTVLTLIVLPSIYLTVNDVRRAIRWLRYGGTFPSPEVVEEAAHDRWLAVR